MKIKLILTLLIHTIILSAQSFMINPYGRPNTRLLNGKWNAIIDPYCCGESKAFYKNLKPQKDTEFLEYSFDGGLKLDVPGDFNSQLPELKYYEGNVWYERKFKADKSNDNHQFIYFAGVNYKCTVWINGNKVGQHEGGFTPFQYDVSDFLKEGENDLVILVNNNRIADGIPALTFDWWNYGGILRDVILIKSPKVYINDYKIQLKKVCRNIISGYVKLNDADVPANVTISIPGLNINKVVTTNNQGYASFEIDANPQLWIPEQPKLYEVNITTDNDNVTDQIGFRTIETKGCDILLNGKSVFMKGINFHEEMASRMGRATSELDAKTLLNEVKALGCNYARTAHYPQNERIVKMAEKMGVLLWEEIPLWQGIDFANPVVFKKAENMLREMIYRDKNRAAVIFWSVSNETNPSESRDKMLINLAKLTRELDDTRLVTSAFDDQVFDKETSTYKMDDKFSEVLDVVGVNKYNGWYQPFMVSPEQIKWNVSINKPLIMSEFGGEAVYGQLGTPNVVSSWSEDFQAELYKKNIIMFKNIPNLRGTSPWILFDFRTPLRLHPIYQDGWNRKGLISNKGQYKKAWYVMKQYYNEIGDFK